MGTPEASGRSPPLQRAFDRERRARKRAEELLETRSRELYESKRALEEAYSATVEVFASLVNGKSGRTSASLRQLAREARDLARRVGLSGERAQVVYLAALLCELGKLALPDEIVAKPLAAMSVDERRQFDTHPRLAYEALMALPPLEAVAEAILCHCELFDGSGYPDRLTWQDTSPESQVLCVVKDFDALKRGLLLPDMLTEAEAVDYLRGQRDGAYRGELVDQFIALVEEQAEHEDGLAEVRLAPRSLRAGMSLTRDLTNTQGVLILAAGQRLDPSLVAKLQGMESANRVVVYVMNTDED